MVTSTVSSADCRIRGADFPLGFGLLARLALGLTKPRKAILGTELAGSIESVGKNVSRFKEGDHIIAFVGAKLGAHAEYLAIPEASAIVIKPPNLSFQEAAALSFGGATALFFLKEKAKIQPGETVLIIGASGAVGSSAVQLARHFGAEVTGVCSSAKLELVKSIGAHHVIDYMKSDFSKLGLSYDIILDTTGTVSAPGCKRLLKEGGRLILVAANLFQMLQALWTRLPAGSRVIVGPAPERVGDLQFLADLTRDGAYKPIIDRSYTLSEIVEAHSYVGTGRKKGSVVITMV